MKVTRLAVTPIGPREPPRSSLRLHKCSRCASISDTAWVGSQKGRYKQAQLLVRPYRRGPSVIALPLPLTTSIPIFKSTRTSKRKTRITVKGLLVRNDQDDMYLRAIHAESDIPTLQEFIQNNPLGVLTTAIPSPDFPTLQVSHIPWIIDTAKDASESPSVLGVLRGHMARQNPQSKTLIESAKSTMEEGAKGGVELKDEVLVLFTADVHHYVTPKFYVGTKPTSGKVVPTWNYSAVQAYGKATVFFDMGSESTEFLSRQIDDLSEHAETSIMGYSGGDKLGPWKVSDAPDKYIAVMQKAIIGIQIEITSLGGKFKMSQESHEKDREGVIAGFQNLNSEIGKGMARTVSDRRDIMYSKKLLTKLCKAALLLWACWTVSAVHESQACLSQGLISLCTTVSSQGCFGYFRPFVYLKVQQIARAFFNPN